MRARAGVGITVVVAVLVAAVAASAVATSTAAPRSPAAAQPEAAVFRNWVAIGDSYSSGEGSPPFDADSAGSRCHRSSKAWPRLLGVDHHLACTGATIDDFYGSQRDALVALNQSRTVDAVTVTIGGNDIPFAGVISDCYQNDCTLAGVNNSIDGVAQRLADINGDGVYHDIETAAPAAEVIVVGYPRLLPTRYQDVVENCRPDGRLFSFSRAEVERLNDAATRLNRRLRQAAGRAGVRYLSTLNALDGHELCTSDAWVRPIKPACWEDLPIASTLCGHPWESDSKHGQRRLADAVTGPLDSNPRRFLNAFLSTWFAGDRAGMANFAAPQTLSEFTTSPSNYTGYRINWQPDYCSLGSSAAGACTFTLLKRGGGSVTYSVGYHEINRLGHLVIDFFDRR